MVFKKEVGTIFRIMDRKTGQEKRQLVADALFVFHHANSYEEGGKNIFIRFSVILICVYDFLLGRFVEGGEVGPCSNTRSVMFFFLDAIHL